MSVPAKEPLPASPSPEPTRRDERRPIPLTVLPGSIPEVLRLKERWVVWRYTLRADKSGTEKWTKPPCRPDNGRPASSTDPETWTSFATAYAAYRSGHWDGIGFVVCDDDDIVGVDVDHCVVDSELDPEVLSELQELDSYGELSPSGEGVRLIALAELPPEGRKRGRFEVYESGRFLTITGHHLDELPLTVESRQAEIEAFHQRRIKPARESGKKRKANRGSKEQDPTAGAVRGSPELTDAEVLAHVRGAANSEKFLAVYAGNDTYFDGDTSAGDLSFCSMVTFYTQNEEQIDRLFRGSARMRDKWDEVHYASGETYGEHTIRVALEGLEEAFAPRVAEANGPWGRQENVLPSPGQWPELATAFREQRQRPLLHHQGVFYEWDGARWVEVEAATIHAEVFKWLTGAWWRKDGGLAPWKPSTAKVKEVVEGVRAHAHLTGAPPPRWISDQHAEDASDIVPMANGLLHVPERRLLPATDEFFNLSAVPYDYDPDAPEPVAWLTFLEDVFDHDPQAIDALQEVFGYLLLPVTWLQKIFAVFGPPRSGKGVILRTLERVLGSDNVTATTFAHLGNQFGQASLIGKSVATLTDARVTGRTDIGAVVERLLTISGEDTVGVPRKHRGDWVGRLNVRFFIVSNDVPFFPDSSTALANRFEPFTTHKSYLGNEDQTLEERLGTETAGILNWALDGYSRLARRGWFKGTASGDEILDAMEISSSPIREFVDEQCQVGPRYDVKKSDLFGRWRWWADERGIRPGSTAELTMRLNSAFPGKFRTTRPRGRGEGRAWRYEGLRLREE